MSQFVFNEWIKNFNNFKTQEFYVSRWTQQLSPKNVCMLYFIEYFEYWNEEEMRELLNEEHTMKY